MIASGAPGEMYRDSVCPKKCFGSLGMALEAGVALSNFTESQFGIGSPRETFPWNLSDTYVQVMPGTPVKAIAHDMVEDAPTRNSMIPVAIICQRRETP